MCDQIKEVKLLMVLDQNIIYQVGLLLTVTVAWICFVIWYKVRKVKETSFPNVVTISIVGIITLLFMIMDTVTIGLTVDFYFKKLHQYMSIVFFILLILYVVIKIHRMSEKNFFVDQSPDLKTMFYSIEDLAVIIDHEGAVVEVNHPKLFQTFFDDTDDVDEILSKIVSDDIISIEESLKKNYKEQPFSKLVNLLEKVFLFTFSAIINKGVFMGYAMVIYDITEMKKVEKALEDQINYIQQANDKLQDSIMIKNSLEVEKSRLELVEQVQKDLIVKIEKMVMYIHKIQETNYNSIADYHHDLHHVADFLREIYRDVRVSIKHLFSEETGVD